MNGFLKAPPIPPHRFQAARLSGSFPGKPRIEAPITVMVVEDEPATRLLTQKSLEKSGFQVRVAEDGEGALQMFERQPPQVVILDIVLPGMDGFEVCRRLRARREDVVILMLTVKHEHESRIKGLELGADDYMVKPFNAGELVARIKAILRRYAPRTGTGDVLEFKNLRIDFRAQKAFKGEAELDLTPREFALLATFLQNPGKVLTRDELNENLWGKDHHGSSKSLDVYIRRLREKVEDDPSEPTLVHTAWGHGYVCE